MRIHTAKLTALAAVLALCLAAPAGAATSPRAVFQQVQERLSQGQPGRAVEEAEESIQQFEDPQQAFQTRVRVTRLVLQHYLQEGSGKAAMENALDTLLEKTQGGARELAYLMAGRIRVFIHEYKAARRTLEKYLNEFPRPTNEELKEYSKKGESPGEAARRHPRMTRRRVAREMLGRLKLVGKELPSFQVTSLGGQPISRDSLKGNPAVLVFWRASADESTDWMQLLQQVYGKYKGQGLQVVGLSVDSDKDQVMTFLDRHDLPWTQVFLGGRRQEISAKFGISALYPASILVDSEGVIRAVDLKGSVLGNEIDRLLKGTSKRSGKDAAEVL